MMVKSRLLLIAAVVMLASLGATAYAVTWGDNVDAGHEYEWVSIDGVCTLTMPDFEWQEAWGVGGDPFSFVLSGPAPSPNDPAVNQTTKNRTPTTWTDWHVVITNGTLRTGLDAPRVYKVGTTGVDWAIEIEGPSSFSAHTVSGSGTSVSLNQFLSVSFNYDVTDPGQTVTISQYPTNTYPIPEPASVMGLVTGLLGFGYGIRRRK